MLNNHRYHITYKGKIFFTMFSHTKCCVDKMLQNVLELSDKNLGIYHIIKQSDSEFDESLIIVTES